MRRHAREPGLQRAVQGRTWTRARHSIRAMFGRPAQRACARVLPLTTVLALLSGLIAMAPAQARRGPRPRP